MIMNQKENLFGNDVSMKNLGKAEVFSLAQRISSALCGLDEIFLPAHFPPNCSKGNSIISEAQNIGKRAKITFYNYLNNSDD